MTTLHESKAQKYLCYVAMLTFHNWLFLVKLGLFLTMAISISHMIFDVGGVGRFSDFQTIAPLSTIYIDRSIPA